MVTITPGRFGLVNVSEVSGRVQGLTPDGVVGYLTGAGRPDVVVPSPYKLDDVPVVRLAYDRGLVGSVTTGRG